MPKEREKQVYVTPSATIGLLRRHGVRLHKGLGQHFLVDNNVILKILDAAELQSSDVVLEVGPGTGPLTKGLADRAGSVVAVEIDERMAEIFRENVKAPNVVLLRSDALELRASQLGDALPAKLVSNLPYNVAVPLLFHLLEEFESLALCVVMVQKEVADRMTAAPGTKEYGAVSVKLSFYARAKRLFLVPPSVFLPPPRVDSAVVRLERRRLPANKDWLFKVVDAAFAQRRKKVLNSLGAGLPEFEKSKIGNALASAGVGPERRAEELRPDAFEKIASSLLQAG